MVADIFKIGKRVPRTYTTLLDRAPLIDLYGGDQWIPPARTLAELTDPAAVPRNVLFRAGQIVLHVRYGYRGVVVAHDPSCQADDAWYNFQILGKGYKPTKEQPWYHVLVDGSDRQTYVAQQNLEPDDSSGLIDHPLIYHFFTTFQDGRYHRPSWN